MDEPKILPETALHDEDPSVLKTQALHGAAERGIAATDRFVAFEFI